MVVDKKKRVKPPVAHKTLKLNFKNLILKDDLLPFSLICFRAIL